LPLVRRSHSASSFVQYRERDEMQHEDRQDLEERPKRLAPKIGTERAAGQRIEHGDDLRDLPLIERKRRLARLLGRAKRRAIQFVEHLTGDGPTVFEHVCRMGLEGIVSKRVDAPYRSGPSKVWVKSKNPASEAVRREREEEWP
jgi:ATP dependent DNA ligase domain